jgi:2'-5' RNA ligase
MPLVSKIAVDVVLLPDEAMMDYAISANARLVKKSGNRILLNKKDCLPHISLAMGCAAPENIPRIGSALKSLAETSPKTLKPVGIQKTTNPSGEIVSVLLVKRSDLLQNLHEKICDVVKPFFSYDVTYDVTEDMVIGRQASPSTLQWIKNYPTNSSHDSFSPHITIGYGELPDRPLPCDFAVSHLAICHLGNHCTCTKILWSAEI